MNLKLDCEQEVDGRWIAEVPELLGVIAYGSSSAAAMAKAEVLALRVIADRLDLHEQLAVSQGQESIGSLAVHWMES